MDSKGWHRRFGSPQDFENEGLTTLQVGGNDPRTLSECLKNLSSEYHFHEVNLNCGCPSIESGGAATYGASLMKQPELTGELISAMRNSLPDSTTVSLKCRIAALDHLDETLCPDRLYSDLHHYVATAQQAGISHLILHARPAILTGLSPVKNRQVPKLDYSVVERIAADFPSLDITMNGGITGLEELVGTSDSVSSFMAGRWMLRRPFDLLDVQSHFLGGTIESIEGRAQKAVEDYFASLMLTSSTSPLLQDACLPVFLITEQLREDHDAHFSESNVPLPSLSLEEIENIHASIVEGLQRVADLSGKRGKRELSASSINFKKLSNSFKGVVGTKVANKWKRNRAEL